jgi:hypothetical protein
MTNTLLNGVLNILVQAILSILGVVATYLITVAVSYFKKKKEALIKQMGIDKYNANYSIAKSVYFSVEQLFKFIPAAAEQKRKMFDSELIKKVPTLTQEELDHFREAVVGEANSQIKKSQILQPIEVYNPQNEIADPTQAPQATNANITTTVTQ